MNNLAFEDCIKVIDIEIAKRRQTWTLSAISWMDFDDVAQIIRTHIYKKWHLFDQSKLLRPWINVIITHQIRNLIRNNYGNFSKPCLHCAANEGDDLCSIYEKQCCECPLFANWYKNRKSAHDTKLPVSLENHVNEVHNQIKDGLDVEKTADNLHKKMQQILKPTEWKVYDFLYIQHKEEEEVAVLMGFKSNEMGRKAGYKQIINIKKSIIKKVKKVLYEGEVDYVY